MKSTDKIKDKVQKEAVQAIEISNGRGIVVMATGAGKSRVPILYAKKHKPKRIALIVPTEHLRDTNWKEEFESWDALDLFERVDAYCYASAHKIQDKDYDLVILDECHHITPLNYTFFERNNIKDIIALTATLPTDVEKKNLLKSLSINPVYTISIDRALELGLVAPFKIVVFYTQLDKVDKYVKAGSKAKPFYTTEFGQYEYLSRRIAELKEEAELNNLPVDREALKRLSLQRMRFIYGLKSKTEAAKIILKSINKSDRTLVFCGGIPQAEELNKETYHSKISDKYLNLFIEEKIDRLSCVNALNEGTNIPNLDKALVVQLNSKELNIVQRIGRVIRKRPGHEAMVYIIVCKGTQDEVWLNDSLKNFNQDNIQYINYKF